MKRIYVCTRSLAENLKNHDARLPPVVVRVDDGPEKYCNRAVVEGPSEVRFDMNGVKGDGQGPHIWVETESEVTTYDAQGPDLKL